MIRAQEALLDSTVQAMPYMEPEERKQLLHQWSLMAAGKPLPETMSEAWTGERESFEDFTRTTMKERIG